MRFLLALLPALACVRAGTTAVGDFRFVNGLTADVVRLTPDGDGLPTCDGAAVGRVVYDDTTDRVNYCDGTSFLPLATFTCGNGVLELGEECDDNNVVDSDGCSAVCLNE